MTTPKARLAGLALIAAMCAGFTLGLTAPAWAGISWDEAEAEAAYDVGDYATAFRKWRPLAKQGNAKAQSRLAAMYYMGLGVTQDYAKALKWSRKAAEQGVAIAQTFVGVIYAEGRGVSQDYAEALKWYRKAAEQGNAKAQNNLGGMYGNGHGVTQDYVQAHMWYNLAVSKSPPGKDRNKAVKNRNAVAKRMTPAQISKAQKLAREWRPKK